MVLYKINAYEDQVSSLENSLSQADKSDNPEKFKTMIRVSDSFFGKKFRRLENWVIFAPLFQKAVYAPGWRNW